MLMSNGCERESLDAEPVSHLLQQVRPGLSKFQAAIRGQRSRKLHLARAKENHPIVCPFYACTDYVVKDVIEVGKIKQNDVVYDLGSGDGGILIPVAVRTGATCFGYEIDEILCATSRRKAKEACVDKLVTIIKADILDVDFSSATVLCVFLTPSCLQFLSSKFKQSCMSGTRIICYKFPLPERDGWIPVAIKSTADVVNIKNQSSQSYIYSYYIP